MKLKLSGADGRISGLEAQLTRTENQKHEVEFKLSSLHSALRRTLGIRGLPAERARYIFSNKIKDCDYDDDFESSISCIVSISIEHRKPMKIFFLGLFLTLQFGI